MAPHAKTFVTAIAALILFNDLSKACTPTGCGTLGTGGCGVQPGCGTTTNCGGGGFQPQPPQPYQPAPINQCGPGCAPTQQCGTYGCFTRRRVTAASVRTAVFLKLGGQSTGILAPEQRLTQRLDPNAVFQQCCIDRQLPDSCLPLCTFDTYSSAALQAMYFKQHKCPLEAAREMHFCAAQGRDHKPCCAAGGVGATLAGPKCMVFCDQRPGVVTQLDMTYIACYERFESIKRCFWQDLVKNNDQVIRAQLQQQQQQQDEQFTTVLTDVDQTPLIPIQAEVHRAQARHEPVAHIQIQRDAVPNTQSRDWDWLLRDDPMEHEDEE